MKKRQTMSSTLLLLIVALFLFSTLSCGIPTYFYYDDSNVLSTVELPTQLQITVSLDDESYNEYVTKDSIPSLKFFYALSTNPLPSSPQSTSSDIDIDNVTSIFNSLYKKSSGNGERWTVESSSSGAGLYLYSENDFTTIQNSIARYESDEITDALVIGTFSQSSTDNSSYQFGTFPEYDVQFPLSKFTLNGSSKEVTFTLDYVNTGLLTSLFITTPDNDQIYLGDYKKNSFIGINGDSAAYLTQLVEYDDIYYNYLSSASTLYLHIYASVSGGEGNFNNIFWTNLYTIGTIQLH